LTLQIAGIATVLLIAGCASIAPQAVSPAEVLSSSRSAQIDASKGVDALNRPLSLEEAMARAVKYNLNERVRRIEQAIALNLWDAGNYDMLPRVLASAGYRSRDNDLITRSRDSVTGLPSLAHPYISSERESVLYDLGTSWSVLDFSVSYYSAKQNADRVLIAAEHRRKAMHALCRDVAIAFWRMASAQRLLNEVKATMAKAEEAVAESNTAKGEGLRSPVENLRYQRQILENIRLLATIEKDFASARTTLASLINAPLGSEFTVIEPAATPNVAILDLPVEQMEEAALLHNADLKEQIYNQRIARTEVRKTIAKLLPNLSLSYDLRYSTDNYLINSRWSEAGLALSQNLTNLFAMPAQRRLAQGGVDLANQRRVAVQMALLAEVHIARLELAASYQQLRLADRIWDIDESIKTHTANRAEAQTESKLTKVAADTASIVSMLRRYQALAEFNVATSTLQATLGLEMDLASVDALSIEDLTRAIAGWQQAWQAGKLPVVDETPAVSTAKRPTRS
jgi:outer membrane protein TolC